MQSTLRQPGSGRPMHKREAPQGWRMVPVPWGWTHRAGAHSGLQRGLIPACLHRPLNTTLCCPVGQPQRQASLAQEKAGMLAGRPGGTVGSRAGKLHVAHPAEAGGHHGVGAMAAPAQTPPAAAAGAPAHSWTGRSRRAAMTAVAAAAAAAAVQSPRAAVAPARSRSAGR